MLDVVYNPKAGDVEQVVTALGLEILAKTEAMFRRIESEGLALADGSRVIIEEKQKFILTADNRFLLQKASALEIQLYDVAVARGGVNHAG